MLILAEVHLTQLNITIFFRYPKNAQILKYARVAKRKGGYMPLSKLYLSSFAKSSSKNLLSSHQYLQFDVCYDPTTSTHPSRFLISTLLPCSPAVSSLAKPSFAPLLRARSRTDRSSFSHSLMASTTSSSSNRAS